MLPTRAWELDLAQKTGFTVSMLRFAVSFFASVPVAITLGRLKSPKGERPMFTLMFSVEGRVI